MPLLTNQHYQPLLQDNGIFDGKDNSGSDVLTYDETKKQMAEL